MNIHRAEYYEENSDPAALAKVCQEWRSDLGGITIKQAAKVLGLPWRTLEGIEQGRGFRYPVMLINAMIGAPDGKRYDRIIKGEQN